MDKNRKIFHKNFLNACRRFKIEKLQQDLLVDFLPFSFWDELFDVMKDLKFQLNHNFLSIHLLKAIEKKTDTEVLDKIIVLHFYDAIYHSNRKTWSVYELMKPNKSFSSARDLKIILESRIKSLNVPLVVMTEEHGFALWILLVEKNKKNTYFPPTYFAYFVDTKYVFASRPTFPVNAKKVLTETFQCHSLKYCDLFGKNINGLMTMLRLKSSSSTSSVERLVKKNFKPDVVRSNEGNNYSVGNQAKAYVRNLFDEEPLLQTLSVKVNGYTLPSEDNSKHIEVVNRLTFKSNNIVRFLESLAEMGILKIPVAEYLMMFPSSGKNALKCTVQK